MMYSNGSSNGIEEIKYKRESHNNFNIYYEIDLFLYLPLTWSKNWSACECQHVIKTKIEK